MMPSVLLPILSGVAALDILDLGLHAVMELEPSFLYRSLRRSPQKEYVLIHGSRARRGVYIGTDKPQGA